MEYVLLALPVMLGFAWTTRRCLRRRAERARLARIRASIAEWLTPEWEDDDPAPDVAVRKPEPKRDRSRWYGSGSTGYHPGRSA